MYYLSNLFNYGNFFWHSISWGKGSLGQNLGNAAYAFFTY